MKTRSTFLRPDWFLALALLAVTLLAYSPALNGKPIWDDDEHLTKPDLQSWHGLGQIWTKVGLTHQYYPLVHTVFWVEHRLWDDNYFGYHAVNVLLHVTSALLVLTILRRLKVSGAWLAAAAFALHPVAVESVAWMSELKNVLSGVFFFASVLCYLSFDQTRKLSSYLLALALFVLGLLCKTVIAILPAALLVVFWWQRNQVRLRRDLLPLLPFFAVGICAGLFTAWVEHSVVGAEGSAFSFSFLERSIIAGRAFWFYLAGLFWPAHLTFIYPRWEIRSTEWWQYLFPLATLLLLTLLWLWRKRWRGPLAGVLFFAGTLFPALGFLNVFPFVYSFVADHFQYLACVGIITLTSFGLTTFVDLNPALRRRRFVLGAMLLLTLAALTWRQAHMYRDEETLWRTVLSRNPESWMAHNNLATGLVKQGRLDEAIAHYEQTLARRPDPAKGYYNLGTTFAKAGKIENAIASYRKAIELRPDYADAHYNLGRALLEQHDAAGAIAEYEKADEFRPNDADIQNNLAGALLESDRVTEAVEHYEAAVRLRSNEADLEYNLAHALAANGRLTEAIAHYNKAITLRPDHADAHYELAGAFLQEGRKDEAIAQYEEVLRLRSNDTKAHINLGSLLFQKGDNARAIAQYEKALATDRQNTAAQINLAWALATMADPALRNGNRALQLAKRAVENSQGADPFALRALSAAYAELGKFPEAIETAHKAIDLATERGNRSLAKALENELGSYKAGQPYRKR